VLTTDNVSAAFVSAAFKHPISVQYQDGRWAARAVRRTSLV
jgi:hypothetical protein